MAGVLVNGCGASDSYYKIKDLGMAQCSNCKKMRPFALMELRMKIRILWIPTVPISKKYAVTCTACKNGYYVDEQQMQDIVNGRVDVEVCSDGILLHGKASIAEQQPQPVPIAEPEPDPVPVQEKSTGGIFGSAAGLSNGFKVPKRKLCPVCNLIYAEEKETCDICGRKLVERK